MSNSFTIDMAAFIASMGSYRGRLIKTYPSKWFFRRRTWSLSLVLSMTKGGSKVGEYTIGVSVSMVEFRLEIYVVQSRKGIDVW